ncbi:MAG: NAD(P)-dependent glycerol-3-phosphate dehydrogenase [Planctomycetota bacterium]|nr:MAG: NAD(P)-dependent glycerol-3-phosphate dehydrogenase [Planctomycetota bacterium]
MPEAPQRSLVVGDGGWGTAIALSLHRAGRPVTVWSHDPDYAAEVARSRRNPKFLPGVEIPGEIRWTADLEEAVAGADIYYSVVPTQFLRATLRRFAGALANLPAVSASKGLELGTLKRPSEILVEAAGARAGVAVLSGPSHAEETARGLATSVVVASREPGLAERVQAELGSASLRLYTGQDLVGVELGGALKNVIAVAAGVADGLGLGDNAKAALVARGLVEMARFGVLHGARRETFFGLSGAGDLMATCYSRHSRNRALGERIGRGETLAEIQASTEKVAEGVWTTEALHAAARSEELELPITEQLHAILFEGRDCADAVRELMLRPSRPEQDSAPPA